MEHKTNGCGGIVWNEFICDHQLSRGSSGCGRVGGRSVTLLEIRWTRLVKDARQLATTDRYFSSSFCGFCSHAILFLSISLFSNSICIYFFQLHHLPFYHDALPQLLLIKSMTRLLSPSLTKTHVKKGVISWEVCSLFSRRNGRWHLNEISRFPNNPYKGATHNR